MPRFWQRIPEQAKIWMSYGHALATAGREQDSIAAYRRCIELEPHFGEAYWSLANLKTFRFEERNSWRCGQLDRADLGDEDRAHFDFALGKALEDAATTPTRFCTMLRAMRCAAPIGLRADDNTRLSSVRGCCSRRNSSRIARVRLAGARSDLHRRPAARRIDADRADPGQPLAGRRHHGAARHHAASRATLSGKRRPTRSSALPARSWPSCGAGRAARSASSISSDTRIQRKTGKPFFIDKMPNNFLHIGLIHLMLPNAKIIDARRHPLGLLLFRLQATFRAAGSTLPTASEDIGRYYRDYVELMAHFDECLPGASTGCITNRWSRTPKPRCARLLDYCGLPFEGPACGSTRTTARSAPPARSR